MAASKKQIEIVAGPNGSGKTTFAQAFFKIRNGKSRFINADTIAAGLSSSRTDQTAFHAGRVMLTAIEEALDAGTSFAFESTLSGKTWLPILQRALKEGYTLSIYFVFLKNPSLNLRRIRQRIKEGGHSIPKSTVLRRYPRSFSNFWSLYRPLCKEWFIFDNSERTPRQIHSKNTYGRLSDLEKMKFEKQFIKF